MPSQSSRRHEIPRFAQKPADWFEKKKQAKISDPSLEESFSD
jgi:hypothetical protein